MTPFDFRLAGAIAIMALLSACGGSAPGSGHDSAALVVAGPAPVADCEADGCNQPRIVDGLAEQYRARAIEPAVEALEPASTTTAAPAADG